MTDSPGPKSQKQQLFADSRSALLRVARDMASTCLAELPDDTAHHVNLRQLAKKWKVSLHFDQPGSASATWSRSGLLAYVEVDDSQLPLNGDVASQSHRAVFALDPNDISTRFVIAHELAHVVLKQQQFAAVNRHLSLVDRERLCDLAAEQILLPSEFLIRVLNSKSVQFSLDFLVEMRARLRCPLSLVIRRLADLVSSGSIRVVNGCLMATLAGARKSGSNIAPRVLRRCVPPEWYLPLNKRLSTLGLVSLEDFFYHAPLYSSSVVSCRFTLWNRNQQRSLSLNSTFAVRCYRYRDRESRLMPRLLLATFDLGVDK